LAKDCTRETRERERKKRENNALLITTNSSSLFSRLLAVFRAFRVKQLSLALVAASALDAQRSAPARTQVDWPVFLARHDMLWNRLPTGWGESVFIGNGRIGATIDVQDGVLGWTVNRTDVVHDDSRFPIGRVYLKTVGVQRSGNARLTLWDAEASGVVVTDSGEVRWRSFVPRDPSVIVVVLEGRGGERRAALDWIPAEARPPRKIARKEAFAPEDLHPAAEITRTEYGVTSVQRFIGGDAHAESIVPGAAAGNARPVYVSIGYGKTAEAAMSEAQRLAGRAFETGESRLSSAHRAWWHAYYPQSFLSFPDSLLESYYWIQMYKLASAMRADGPILDLAGPWFRATPWPAIWWNLNIQLTYSPLFRANRLDLAESLFRNLDRNTQALIENVPERLRGDAAAIGRSSGPNLVRHVDLATAQSEAAKEMGDLPWTMYYYWLHYRYQMDDRILRDRVYPLLRRAIGNYLGYVERGADGKWHLPPTHSPELATVPDANYDLALLRWGLQTLIASAERLRINDPQLARWRDVLANLTPFPSDSAGLMVGRDRPWKESHRHYSHLLAIYPLGLITPDGAAGRTLIERSLQTWEGQTSLFRGYSFTGGAAMHARLGHGDVALTRLNQYLDAPRYMEPNTFYAEAGPVIETPLSAAASIQELFLQDWGGLLRVFPAVPSVWKDAAFDRLRAEGAFLVSAVRRDGRTAWVRITSLAGQPLRVRVADWDSAVVRERSGTAARLTRSADGTFAIDLPKNGSVLLAPSARTQLPPLAPVARPDTARPWPALKPDSQPARYQDRPDMAWWRASMDSLDRRLGWWRDARFGMFIHWGVYSQLAGVWDSTPVRGYAEHIQRIRKIPSATYREQAVSKFNPTRFDADEWVNLARRAGMRYMIITAKHHDGFAMYDSKVTDYDIVDGTPYKRDPLRELRDAAKRRGVRFGFYYSHAFDWGDPEAPGNDWEFENPGGDRNLYGREWWVNHPQLLANARRYVDRKAIPQILELIKNYDPDILWFDTPQKLPPEENLRILRAAREAKPTIVINGRPVQAFPGAPEARFGDYASTADRPAELTRHDGDWEAIPTTNESYGYHRMDLAHKPPEHFVLLLAKAAARGVILLMKIGPMGDGRLDAKDSSILEGFGAWLEVNA
jgi:alpha-L-fucosidase 2